MEKRKKVMTGGDMASRSMRQGGSSSLADVHRGPRSGLDGAIHRAIYGDDPLDYGKAIESEMARLQETQPDRFIRKIARHGVPKRAHKS